MSLISLQYDFVADYFADEVNMSSCFKIFLSSQKAVQECEALI